MPWLDYKRNQVTFDRSWNPSHGHLQAVGIPKAVANVSVPNLVGLTKAAAITALSAVNLGHNDCGGVSATATSQTPIAATLVPKGYSVNVFY